MRSARRAIALGILSCFLFLPLSSCDTEKLSEDLAATTEGFLPNLYVTIAQVLIFAAVCAIAIAVAYKPLRRKIAQRKKYISDSVEQADRDKEQAKAALEKAEKTVGEAQKQAAGIVAKAQAVADEDIAKAQREIALSIEQQKVQAHRDIQAERERMISSARDLIADAAIGASREILKREITADDNRKLVDEFIDQLSETDGSTEEDQR